MNFALGPISNDEDKKEETIHNKKEIKSEFSITQAKWGVLKQAMIPVSKNSLIHSEMRW